VDRLDLERPRDRLRSLHSGHQPVLKTTMPSGGNVALIE